MPAVVRTEPLTAHRFRPFGTVLESPRVSRQDFAAQPVSRRASANVNLALLRVQPVHSPLVIRQLERHRYSTQTFFPLELDRYLVVVCRATSKEEPDLETLLAFECSAGQAVQYDTGTWHAAINGIGGEAVFAMLIYEDGTAGDCEIRDVLPFQVVLTD